MSLELGVKTKQSRQRICFGNGGQGPEQFSGRHRRRRNLRTTGFQSGFFRFAARHRDARLDTQNCAGTRACALPEFLLHRKLRAQTQQETSTAPPSIARVPERQVFGCGRTFGARPGECLQPAVK